MKIIIMTTILHFSLIISFAAALAAPAPEATPVEKTMSIDVKDTDIRDVIRMISKGYNLSILLDKDVIGKVTLHLSDVPIMEGLRSIAESNGLSVVKEGSVYKIQKATLESHSAIRYADGKLSVDVQNMDVIDFLNELSAKSPISIVPDAKVNGRLTGKLYQVNLEDGLRALLEGNGFKVSKHKNIYQVLSAEPGASGAPTTTYPRSYMSSYSPSMNVDYSNGLVSLDVSNGDLEGIIKSIADQSDMQIITYGSIKGEEVNAKLKNIPLTDALALLLGGTRFTFVQKDNVILIGDRNTATPSGQALSKSELIHLKHIKADLVPAILPKDIPPANVKVIKEQNALLISGTSEDIVSAHDFLKTIDIPTPQVRIDGVIVEYKEDLNKQFGLRYGRNPQYTNGSYMIAPSPSTSVDKGADNFEIGLSGKFIKDFASRYLGKNTIVNKLDDDFFAVLQFLESQDKAKVLAQPSILTLNGNKASIDVSETQYFKISTGVAENYTTRFQPIKFGIQLDFTPWISQSGQITAEITPSVSNSDNVNSEGYPNVAERSITTTVRINDGQTLILGGLVQNQESVFHHKIPLLGDIPILGALFRYSGKTRTKSNLMIYITPHIVTEDQGVNMDKEMEMLDLKDNDFMERNFFRSSNSSIQQYSVIIKHDSATAKSKTPPHFDNNAEPATNVDPKGAFFPSDNKTFSPSSESKTMPSANDSKMIPFKKQTVDSISLKTAPLSSPFMKLQMQKNPATPFTSPAAVDSTKFGSSIKPASKE